MAQKFEIRNNAVSHHGHMFAWRPQRILYTGKITLEANTSIEKTYK